MSGMTDYVIDMMMEAQRWVSRISLDCPKCHSAISQEVDVPFPDLSAEKTRDMTTDGDVQFDCEHCGEYFEGDVYAGPAHCDIELRSHDGVSVYCEPPGYDRPPEDWYDEEWTTPSDPAAVFQASLTEINVLVGAYAQDDGSTLMNRMIFTQILTSLEAFFCDTLIIGLSQHPERLQSFAARDEALKGLNFTAAAVLKDPDIIEKTVRFNLKSRLYYKFGDGKTGSDSKPKPEGVALWYLMAFGFSPTPSVDEVIKLREYALLRHDCVHRNGKTKDDEILTVFEKPFLQDALSVARRVVDHVNAEMSKL